MPYGALLANDTIRPHGLTATETARRLREMEHVARRHLADADAPGLSSDGRHNLAYTAARVAAEMVMLAEGFRAGRGMGKHAAVFVFLSVAVNGKWATEADYLDKCRQRRNVSEYEQAGTISPTQADTAARAARRLLDEVLAWLQETEPPQSEESAS